MFGVGFLLAAAALALWIDARFPELAPESLLKRLGLALVATFLVTAAPVVGATPALLLATLLGAVFPTFVLALLTALWLLRGVRDRITT